MKEIVTEIDARNRSGCLTGIARTGERYSVERVSPIEIRFRLLEPAKPVRPKIVRRGGMAVLAGGRALTAADVAKELEAFP